MSFVHDTVIRKLAINIMRIPLMVNENGLTELENSMSDRENERFAHSPLILVLIAEVKSNSYSILSDL